MQGQKEMLCATPEDRVLALKKMREGVEVKDRRYHLKTYKQVFVGSEAVDFLVNSGLATSRDDAVRMGLELQHDFNFFRHVVDDHLFKDDHLFYRFNDVSECGASDAASEISEDDPNEPFRLSKRVGLLNMGEIIRANVKVHYKYSVDKECFNCEDAVDFLVTSGLASTRLDAVHIGQALERKFDFFHNVMLDQHGQKFQDARLFFSFEREKSDAWKGELQSVRAAFQSNIKVKDRTYHLKVYKDCFTGKDAVDCMLALGETTTRQDAVLLGRSLMYEYFLFAHVTGDHPFEDSDLFYRFSRVTRESSQDMTLMEMKG